MEAWEISSRAKLGRGISALPPALLHNPAELLELGRNWACMARGVPGATQGYKPKPGRVC